LPPIEIKIENHNKPSESYNKVEHVKQRRKLRTLGKTTNKINFEERTSKFLYLTEVHDNNRSK